MKPYFILSIILVVVMIILPAAAKIHPQRGSFDNIETSEKTVSFSSQQTSEVKVFRSESEEINNVNITEYIIGTVAGEMPASFCTEALKAQAVASYTYMKYLMYNSANGNISDSSAIHQKYIDTTQQKEKWGDSYEENRKKIKEAVESVSGQYLSYKGKPALTAFHAISSGKTKSSQEVWGKALPYLCIVDAPGDTLSEKYESVVTFSPEEFKSAFEENADLTFEDEDFKNWASVYEKDIDGYIKTLTVCKENFSSSDVRNILALPGASFKGTIEDGNYVFTVHGRGHGVGMSQYSADYMARQGADYKKILEHFYPGTIIMED